MRMLKHESSVCTFTASTQGKSMLSGEWRADQTRASGCLAWRGRSLLLKLGEKEKAAWWKGVRVRLVKSREAVILHGWREKVSTWSQRSSASSPSPPLPSPPVPQVGIKTQPSDGGMQARKDGGREGSSREPGWSFDSPGFLTSTTWSLGPRPREGRLSLKPQPCQKLIAAALLFNYQFKVECCCSLGWI